MTQTFATMVTQDHNISKCLIKVQYEWTNIDNATKDKNSNYNLILSNTVHL